jgi:hypothetical protein
MAPSARRRHGRCSSLLPMQLLGAATAAPRRSVAREAGVQVNARSVRRMITPPAGCFGAVLRRCVGRTHGAVVPGVTRRLRGAGEAPVHCLRYTQQQIQLLATVWRVQTRARYSDSHHCSLVTLAGASAADAADCRNTGVATAALCAARWHARSGQTNAAHNSQLEADEPPIRSPGAEAPALALQSLPLIHPLVAARAAPRRCWHGAAQLTSRVVSAVSARTVLARVGKPAAASLLLEKEHGCAEHWPRRF